MIVNNIEFKKFDPEMALLSEIEEIHHLKNRLKIEMHPTDNLVEFSNTLAELRISHPLKEIRYWIARDLIDSKIVGLSKIQFENKCKDNHIVWFDILVLPSFRMKGIGKGLFSLIKKYVMIENKKYLMSNTVDTVFSGELFMKSLGFIEENNLVISQLKIKELDIDLVDNWISLAPKQFYSVGLWNGPYPENELESIIRVKESMNTDEIKWTKEKLRSVEQFYLLRNVERWTVFVKDNQKNNVVGYSEIFWHASENDMIYQGDTGVLKECQGRGLAKWMKAYMIRKVVFDKNQIKFIRVSNSRSNDAILHINKQLGYNVYQNRKTWKQSIALLF